MEPPRAPRPTRARESTETRAGLSSATVHGQPRPQRQADRHTLCLTHCLASPVAAAQVETLQAPVKTLQMQLAQQPLASRGWRNPQRARHTACEGRQTD